MNQWLVSINTPAQWALFFLLLVVVMGVYFASVSFVQKLTTGILGGLILLALGLGLVLGPAFYLMQGNHIPVQIALAVAAIVAGCCTLLMGAFSLRNFSDF